MFAAVTSPTGLFLSRAYGKRVSVRLGVEWQSSGIGGMTGWSAGPVQIS